MSLVTTPPVSPKPPIEPIANLKYPLKPVQLPEVISTTPQGDPWPRPYYIENGLRRVAPYHFTYNTYCKQRWRGRTILDIFTTEFRDRDREYYREAIEAGRIAINNKPCSDVNRIVKNGDVVAHTLHRHEPPVSAQPVGIIHEDENMIVIDKPAGVPVHPAGRYKFNSVVEIMRAERDYSFNPLPCNRLDRLTSGVMFIGKWPKEAEKISEKLRSRTMRKEYVARVVGRFPDGEGIDPDKAGGNGRGGVVKCEESILQISPILGLNRARATGKSAKTLFRRIAYHPPKDGRQTGLLHGTRDSLTTDLEPTTENLGYSIVQCLPLTGRTHQIRVHLQFLGHPISNDPIYSNRRVFGNGLAQNDASSDNDADIIARLSRMGKDELPQTSETVFPSMNTPQADLALPSENNDPARPRHLRLEGEPHKGIPQGTLHASSALDVALSITPSPKPAEPNSTTNTTEPPPPTPPAAQRPTPATSPKNHFSTTLDLSAGYADPTHGALLRAHDEQVSSYNQRRGEKLTGEVCAICDTPLYSDPSPEDLGIYLHASAYADLGGQWRFVSRVPVWAAAAATDDDDREGGVGLKEGDEMPEWVDSGLGWEAQGVGDEKEEQRLRNREGERRNRELDGNGNGLG
jgi:tRNA pseudouridine32 synthase